jgi:hypothetical protein
VPTLISALRLWFDKETTSFKKYLLYCGWAFMPVWNLVLTWFVFLEFRDKLKISSTKVKKWENPIAVLALRKRNFDDFVAKEGEEGKDYIYINSVEMAKGRKFSDVIYLFNWSGLKDAYDIDFEVRKRLV